MISVVVAFKTGSSPSAFEIASFWFLVFKLTALRCPLI
jgi:hypothetical protein